MCAAVMLTQTVTGIPDEIVRTAAAHADTAVQVHSDVNPYAGTLGELFDESRRVAASLVALGIRPGDVVAIQLPNWRECFTAHAAIWLAGAVALPIVPIYGPAEVAFIAGQSGARALILAREIRKRDAGATLTAVADLPGLHHHIVVGPALSGTRHRVSPRSSPTIPTSGVCWCTPPEPPPSPRVCSTPMPACWARSPRWIKYVRQEQISPLYRFFRPGISPVP